MVQTPRADPLCRTHQHPHLFRGIAEVPPGSARASRTANSRRITCASAWKHISILCRFYSQPLEAQVSDLHKYPLNAITQRPMAMYHSWDSQNPWLRQIHTYNFLNVNTKTAREAGIEDGGWMWVESMHGKVRCLCRHSEAVEPGTVWTWNAIGKASGAWGPGRRRQRGEAGLPAQPPDSTRNCRRLLMAITCPIRIPLPARPVGTTCTYAFTRPTLMKPQVSSPQFDTLHPVPGQMVSNNPGRWLKLLCRQAG